MNFDKLKEFFTQLFTSLNTKDSYTVLFFLITSFLLGALFSWLARGGTIRRLKKELKKKEEAHKLLNAEMVGLREQFELKEADLKKAQLEADDYQLKLAASKEEKAQLLNDLNHSNTQAEELRQANLNFSTTIEDLNDQILGLKAKNNQIEIELKQNQEEQDLDDAEIAGIKNNFDSTINRLASLEEKINLLESENQNLKSKLQAVDQQSAQNLVSNDLAEVKDLLRKLAEENADLKTEIHSFKDSSLLQSSSVSEKDMKDILARLELLESENKTLRSTLNELQDTPIEFVEIEEEEDILQEESNQERTDRARKAIKDALGTRIKAASEAEKDDLQTINGIGPFIEEKLNEVEIYTFEQISQLDDELIKTITEAIEFFPGRIHRDNWVGQARAILSKG